MYATGAMESCQLNAARIVVRRLNVVVRSHISRPTIYSESETMGYKPNDGIMSVYGAYTSGARIISLPRISRSRVFGGGGRRRRKRRRRGKNHNRNSGVARLRR